MAAEGPLAHDAPLQIRAVTFNTGIPQCSRNPEAEYSCDDAETASEWYGTGLSHRALFPDTTRFLAAMDADVIGIQEIFHPGECPEIPEEFHEGFICEGWQPGDPTVAQQILGSGYQIACHPGRPDKCIAVKRDFGRIRGCKGDLCLDHLEAGSTSDCGGGTRIARGIIDLRRGGSLTVVNIHGTSGVTGADQNCRAQQLEQVFVDIRDGSGEPAANGRRNIVLGDINTDPGRFPFAAGAMVWNRFVGEQAPFRQISEAGLLAPPTHPTGAELVNIDHVASDAFDGTCFVGDPTEIRAYDHSPIVCDLRELP